MLTTSKRSEIMQTDPLYDGVRLPQLDPSYQSNLTIPNLFLGAQWLSVSTFSQILLQYMS